MSWESGPWGKQDFWVLGLWIRPRVGGACSGILAGSEEQIGTLKKLGSSLLNWKIYFFFQVDVCSNTPFLKIVICR